MLTTKDWREVFRKGLAPTFTDAELSAIADGLRSNDPRLTQGSTTTPPPLEKAYEDGQVSERERCAQIADNAGTDRVARRIAILIRKG